MGVVSRAITLGGCRGTYDGGLYSPRGPCARTVCACAHTAASSDSASASQGASPVPRIISPCDNALVPDPAPAFAAWLARALLPYGASSLTRPSPVTPFPTFNY